MTPLRWPLSHRSHRAVAHATRRRMAPAAMTAALALVLVPALSASAAWAASSDTDTSSAAASDSSKTDPTTCIGAYSLASSFSSQMVSMPSHMQRYLAATAAQRFWTMAASECPAEVFAQATVYSSIAAYRAQILASALGIPSDELPDYYDDSTAVLAAVRGACGYDTSFTRDVRSANGTCTTDNARDTIGLATDELSALATATDRVAYYSTTASLRTGKPEYAALYNSASLDSTNYASMMTAANVTDDRRGIYSSSIVAQGPDTVTDPVSGISMATTRALVYDACAETLSGFSSQVSAGSSTDDGANSDATGPSSSESSSDTTQGIDVSSDEGSHGANTDPFVNLDNPYARRRAVSESIAKHLLDCYNDGVPARDSLLLN